MPQFAEAVGAASKIFELVDHVPAVNYAGGEKLADVRGHLRFAGVVFIYPSRPETSVLRGFDLELKVGTTTALVGTSGNGKSTVVNLLQRCAARLDSYIR